MTQPVHELPALRLEIVQATSANARLWNEYMARYHELGFTPLSGSQMRYAVFAGDRWVALLSFGASAWRLASRDAFIGWSDAQRPPAARSQQRALPHLAVGDKQGPGIQGIGNGRQASAG